MDDQRTHVVVALSGGVDSSVAATALQEAGYKVRGLHLVLPSSPYRTSERLERAMGISSHLRIPLAVVDLRNIFTREVVEPFVHSYLKGLTPNPCVRCNPLIKFAYLLHYANRNGIQYAATGHYVRLMKNAQTHMAELWRGRDHSKEQSYFLHRLTQDHLKRCLFPLGNMTKQEVRRRAQVLGLPTRSNPESQEICFIPGNDYRVLIENARGAGWMQRGRIVDVSGRVLGEHAGTYRYTIGQRRGLGIASSRPYYVIALRPDQREVVVGRKEELFLEEVEASEFTWIEGFPTRETMKVSAQVRYRHQAAPGLLQVISSDRVKLVFDSPQWAITPGQALVCYEGARVLGGGWIMRARNPELSHEEIR